MICGTSVIAPAGMPDSFRQDHPNIRFNVNGEGDVPMRLGAADIFIDRDEEGRATTGDRFYLEHFLPVGSPETAARLTDPYVAKPNLTSPRYQPVGMLSGRGRSWRHTEQGSLEGFPLLHLQEGPGNAPTPTWADWLAAFPYQRDAPDRGVRYAHVRDALEGVKSDAGFLICGLSLVLREMDAGAIRLPFPAGEALVATHPYRVASRTQARARPQVSRFLAWLTAEATVTRLKIDALLRG